MLPVLVGSNYEHVMTQATIVQEPDKVTITIIAEGEASRYLGDYLTAEEPVALSFGGIPVRPTSNRNKE